MHPPDGPPVWAALKVRFFLMPPPMSKTTSPRVVPIGTSTIPVLLMDPARANTLVPLLLSVPMPANQSAPLRIIGATLAYVSTLHMMVGLPNRPLWNGNGGFCLGSPLSPSMEAISAVSSPHTKAPAPILISISKSKPDPSMSRPSRPASLASVMALPSLSTASGYSALT